MGTDNTIGRAMAGGRRSRRRRKAIAVTELAVCLPILVVLLLATIEACVMLQLKQNLCITAFEGTRIGILPGSDAADVELQCEMILDDRGVEAYTITMNPDPSILITGDIFSVSVSADCVANSVVGGAFYQGKTMSETVVMRAE